MRTAYFLPFILVACSTPEAPVVVLQGPTAVHCDDLRSLYDSAHVTGSFLLHDTQKDHWVFIDSGKADVATLPASTFKIFSSLYALESGVAKDADEVFKWDGTDYGRSEVNKDLTLRESVKWSAYWVHRDIARRAGGATLKHWLDTVGYGNADTSGGFDRAWVRGNLRITPRQQIHFLERLERNELPFSQRSMDIVKEITVREDTLGHRLHAKTGWGIDSEGSVGWYVGWVERPDSLGPVFFANRIQTPDTLLENFSSARINIAMTVLKDLGYWPQ